MPVQRFRLAIDESGRGSLFDLDTDQAIEGVVGVRVEARVGQPTRVIVEYLASVEGEVAVDAAEVEVVEVGSRPPPPEGAGGRAASLPRKR